MAWSRAEDEVRAIIERAQIPFLRSPMGKGVMPLRVGLPAESAAMPGSPLKRQRKLGIRAEETPASRTFS